MRHVRVYMRIVLFFIFATMFLVGGTVVQVQAASVKQMTSALLKEGAQLGKEGTSLKKEFSVLSDIRNQLIQKGDTLKREVKEFARKTEQLNREHRQIKTSIENYNSYCRGRFLGEEYRKRKAWCDPNFHTLNNRKKQWKQDTQGHNNKWSPLMQKRDQLSKKTLDWAAKQKSYNARADEHNARRMAWTNRVRVLMSWPSLEDLKKRERISVQCANISNAIVAWTCLQKVWDGAK
ncbi:MAG: hypothetical protein BMS9Abin13_407 [Patescibacteria group bacterium]|nr:MAG: hypothetical protein BMS9Abin13_407 [Patescibacteria group bacterium]